MKKFITLSVFIALFANVAMFGQAATGNCNSITATLSSNPPYPPDCWGQGGGYSNCTYNNNLDCCRTIYGTTTPWQPTYLLQKKSGSNWTNQGGFQLSNTFSNLSHGTYRIQVRVPIYKADYCNEDYYPFTPCYNTIGQFIGFWGAWDDTQYFTNEVVVGATIQSDIASTFIDGDGIDNSGPNAFDYLEQVRVDASQSKNYTSYAIAIQEFGGANRWHPGPTWQPGPNGGFTNAQLGVEDLTYLWKYGTELWEFEPFNSYRLQIVIKNDNCPGEWIQTLPFFFICPQGQGCRLGHDNAKISISPNPASNRLTLTNLDITPKVSENYTLTIHELSGKEVKRFTSIRENEFDISDLSNGVYVVSLHNQKEGIFHEKLVITK